MAANSDCKPEDRMEPIAVALARAGEELEIVVAMIHGLEDVVGHAIMSARSTRELQIEELQQLDRVRQKVEGAAGFINALTRALPDHWQVDAMQAASKVAMSDLARKLGGGGAPQHDPGELIELF